MSFRESHNYTHNWARKMRGVESLEIVGTAQPAPLEVKDPEVLKAVKEELDYIFTLDSVKKSEEYADEISLHLKKGDESKRSILRTSPRINIQITRDEEKNILKKTMHFQRDTKNCEFIFSKDENGIEVMSIGRTNLDAGYNSGVHGWVQGGMRLLKDAIEEDYYTPYVSTNIEYSQDSVDSTEETIKGTPKGPMEI